MNTRAQSVLFVTTSFPRFHSDFAGSFVFRFAKYLVSDGMQVTVLAPAAAGYQTVDAMEGIQVYRLPYFYPARLQRLAYDGGGMLANLRRSWLATVQAPLLFLAMVWAIKRYQAHFDIIHCHWLPTAVAALIARLCSRTKPAIVLTNWGSDTRHLPTWLTRWTVARVEGCISTAVETDKHLQATGRTEFRRIMAPVDEERFRRTAVAADMRHELGIDENISVIPFVGRLDAFKDPLTFIRACAVLRQQGVSFIAPIAGDGNLMSECQQEIQKYKLHDCMILLGMRSDPERLFRIATATIHISPIENTWANAIAEAMFMEVPVVLSNAGYTQFLFTHEKNCLIVPVQNPVALAGALQRLIEDRALRTQLIRGSSELLRQYKKDRASIVREVRAYYDELQWRRAEIAHHA
jgi:glycosyltransferase involved in cell wall biosynthesis